MAKISVMGAGGWGLALGKVLADNGHEVMIWGVHEDSIEDLRTYREHKTKLPGVLLPESLVFTSDMALAATKRDLILLVVPSRFIRETVEKMKPYIKENQLVLDASKGIEADSCKRISEQIEEILPSATVAVLSGPSHAEEVGRGLSTAVVIGAESREIAEYLQGLFMNDAFRVYTSSDVIGIELGGSLKNVVALAAGMADGLGCGDNTKAALITRGIAEISRLGVKMGGRPETFAGLTGMGDLIVTCASMHSRNRRAGILIGEGKTMEEAMKEVNMVVEGVYSTKAAVQLADRYHVSMPIVREVERILFEGKDPGKALRDLMMRDGRVENANLSWKNR